MADAEPTAPLLELLRQLETVLGRTAAPDVTDGHVRWHLCRAATRVEAALPILLRAVSQERDPSLASAVVVEVLERLAPQERAAWVQALDPAVRDFSARRVQELEALEAVDSGHFTTDEMRRTIDSWTNWLQLRIVAVSDDREILLLFSELGRTKRIRNTALSSLK
ncbi:hypothetical protein ACFYW6_11365 [Streptomyces sp. NPDC002659]|uniref:hypothetical protein n=1 Tax=Streptomyces sp. NPDC002659 TaxID=3364656 RepID=UPI003682B06B